MRETFSNMDTESHSGWMMHHHHRERTSHARARTNERTERETTESFKPNRVFSSLTTLAGNHPKTRRVIRNERTKDRTDRSLRFEIVIQRGILDRSSTNEDDVNGDNEQREIYEMSAMMHAMTSRVVRGGAVVRGDRSAKRRANARGGRTLVRAEVPTGDGDAQVIVVTSGKGGVGKTTSSANLGMSMARLGYRTALIDADIGLRNLDLLLGLENRVMYTAMEVLEGECRMEQALIRDKRWRTLALLPISKNRARYNVTKNNMQTLIKVLKEMEFQYIIIDCPAGIDVGFINAIACADKAVIVTTPEITAIRDADRVAGLLEANGVYDVKLLVNRVRADMIKKNDMMSVKDVQEMLGVPLLGAIPEDTEVIVSTNRGEPLVLKKKLTLAGIAYENAARRIVGKDDFLIDLDRPKKGIFQRVGEFFSGDE
jgi:septum site-determining protein MinD